jgi:hypothetical protein
VSEGDLQVVIASTSLWVGEAAILVVLEDAANQPIELDGLAITARLAPDVDAHPGRVVKPLAEGRHLVRFDLSLAAPGRHRLEVEATDGLTVRRGSTELTVRDPAGVPTRGTRVPATVTPTAGAVDGVLARITSDPLPMREFYWLSVDRALAAERPFALVVDSFRFRVTQACGGALGVMRHLAGRFPGVSVIHVEPFAMEWDGRTLSLDPPAGPARLAPWTAEWGLGADAFGPSDVPWIFVVGGDGRVAGTFQGVVGTEELAVALGEVSPWTPSGGAGLVPTLAPWPTRAP